MDFVNCDHRVERIEWSERVDFVKLITAHERLYLMLNCGKKKNRNKSDISNVAKMAEAIDDDVNNSNNKSNITAAVAVAQVGSSNSGNGDMNFATNNHNINCNSNSNQSGRRSIQRFSCSRCCNDIFNYLLRFRGTPEELEQRYKSREIDKFLEKDKHTFRRQVNFRLWLFSSLHT